MISLLHTLFYGGVLRAAVKDFSSRILAAVYMGPHTVEQGPDFRTKVESSGLLFCAKLHQVLLQKSTISILNLVIYSEGVCVRERVSTIPHLSP